MGEIAAKLTPAQRKALVWVQAHEPVSAFPCNGTAPSIHFVKKLQKIGLVETAGVEAGRFGFTRFQTTRIARELLDHPPSPKNNPTQVATEHEDR